MKVLIQDLFLEVLTGGEIHDQGPMLPQIGNISTEQHVTSVKENHFYLRYI